MLPWTLDSNGGKVSENFLEEDFPERCCFLAPGAEEEEICLTLWLGLYQDSYDMLGLGHV